MLDDARRILNIDPGYRPEHTLTFGINPAYDNEAKLGQFYEELLSSLKLTSGIDAVGGATWLPPDDPFHSSAAIRPEGSEANRPDAPQPTPFRIVSPDYFRAMGISILEGREFTASDSELNCIVVSESLASRFWPGITSVVGRRLVFPGRPERLLTVIGVARNVRQDSMDNVARPFAYLPSGKIRAVWFYFVLRGPLDRISLTAAVRRSIRRLDPGLAIFDVQTLKERIDRGLGPRRAWTLLFGIFGIAGLVLAAAGIYGVISYSVSRRTREIGIRIALGSRSDAVALLSTYKMSAYLRHRSTHGTGGFMGGLATIRRTPCRNQPARSACQTDRGRSGDGDVTAGRPGSCPPRCGGRSRRGIALGVRTFRT